MLKDLLSPVLTCKIFVFKIFSNLKIVSLVYLHSQALRRKYHKMSVVCNIVDVYLI